MVWTVKALKQSFSIIGAMVVVNHQNLAAKHLTPQDVGPRDVITEDGLIARDPHWGSEEVKKIDKCLRWPDGITRKQIGDYPVGIRFTIDGVGRISKVTRNRYYRQSGMSQKMFSLTQSTMTDALTRSKIRAPAVPGLPARAVYDITRDKSELSLYCERR